MMHQNGYAGEIGGPRVDVVPTIDSDNGYDSAVSAGPFAGPPAVPGGAHLGQTSGVRRPEFLPPAPDESTGSLGSPPDTTSIRGTDDRSTSPAPPSRVEENNRANDVATARATMNEALVAQVAARFDGDPIMREMWGGRRYHELSAADRDAAEQACQLRTSVNEARTLRPSRGESWSPRRRRKPRQC